MNYTLHKETRVQDEVKKVKMISCVLIYNALLSGLRVQGGKVIASSEFKYCGCKCMGLEGTVLQMDYTVSVQIGLGNWSTHGINRCKVYCVA